MKKTFQSYEKIIGKDKLQKIKNKAKKLKNSHILYLSSTYQGGGVAEILNSAILLYNEIGVRIGWRVLHGNDRFFSVTKRMHNGLQGGDVKLSKRKRETYYETNRRFSQYTHIEHDLVVVHDPQPAAMINFYKRQQPWIFRYHIDLSNPNKEVWNYLKQFVNKYDHLIISNEKFKKPDIEIPQSIIYPAIDPLSAKNRPLQKRVVEKVLTKRGINTKRPILTQISRFDKWKDPLGVIKVFENVRKKSDCQLVLLGSFATDDPEGLKIYNKVNSAIAKSKYKKDIKILCEDNSILVNALQRQSTVIIQKSTKEGFGLTVSEALYKGTAVIASDVGGIPLQVIDGKTGFLCKPKDYKGFSEKIIQLIEDESLRNKLGKAGKEHVKENFLITTLMDKWMDLFIKMLKL